jgi:holo-[acyl-carrier protein] synthase
MINGLGTDLVDVNRMAQKIKKSSFIALVFTEYEIGYCSAQKYPAQHYAARFAAKEAYMKAISKGWSKDADFKEIEVRSNSEGAPSLHLSGATSTFFHDSKFKQIFVSLSHTESIATATVIITD